jgi:hypothetical protein
MRVRHLRSRPAGSCAPVTIGSPGIGSAKDLAGKPVGFTGTGLDPAQVSYAAGILYKYKGSTPQPSYSQIVNDSYASQALAKLGS